MLNATEPAQVAILSPPALSSWLKLFRPVTLVPVLLIALLFGLVGAGGWPGPLPFLRIVIAGGLLTALNGISNIWNQLGDWREDSVHPTKAARPLVSGQIDPLMAMSVSVLVLFGSLAVAGMLLPPIFSLLYLAVAFFAWTYSYWPRMKARFPANMLWIGTPRGALGIAAAWVVFGSILDYRLWVILFVTVPFVALGNESRNIADREADAYAGVRNVATLWGEQRSREVAGLGMAWPAIAAVILLIHFADYWLLLWILPAAVGIWAVGRWPGERVWLLWYALYGVLCVLLAVPFLLYP
jgi:4-hydroxybenzoate polyprenyltransferase